MPRQALPVLCGSLRERFRIGPGSPRSRLQAGLRQSEPLRAQLGRAPGCAGRAASSTPGGGGWDSPGALLHESLKQFRRQLRSQVGIADLVLEDNVGRLLVVEVKKGKLPRGAINQLVDYLGMLKPKFALRAIELMVVANSIPQEPRIACEQYDIECREISEKRFRAVAKKVGYKVNSVEDQANGESVGALATAPELPANVGVSKNQTAIGKARECLGANWTVRELAGALKVNKSNAHRRLKKWLASSAVEKLSAGRRGRKGGLARYQFKIGTGPNADAN